MTVQELRNVSPDYYQVKFTIIHGKTAHEEDDFPTRFDELSVHYLEKEIVSVCVDVVHGFIVYRIVIKW